MRIARKGAGFTCDLLPGAPGTVVGFELLRHLTGNSSIGIAQAGTFSNLVSGNQLMGIDLCIDLLQQSGFVVSCCLTVAKSQQNFRTNKV